MNKKQIEAIPAGELCRMQILPVPEVTFPGVRVDLQINDNKTLKMCKQTMDTTGMAFIYNLTEDDTDMPKDEDLVGVIAYIGGLIRTEDGDNGVILHAIRRGILKQNSIEVTDSCPSGLVEFLSQAGSEGDEVSQALFLSLEKALDTYVKTAGNITKQAIDFIRAAETLSDFTDRISQYIFAHGNIKQELLKSTNVKERAQTLIEALEQKTYIIGLEATLNKKMSDRAKEAMREKYLREQLDVIREELGDYGDYSDPEIMDFKDKITASKMPEESKNILTAELDRFSKMGPYSSEASIIRSYLQTCLELPWNEFSEDKTDLKNASEILEKDHYGLEKVKERILQFLAVRILNPENNGTILCLVGPPGTGKTSVAASIAAATGRKFQRISLGGVYDESEIRGHRRTYLGSMPGMIIDAIKRAQTSNPVILLDEIDKLSKDYKGDPASALLEALDPEQNKTFKDHYIDMPFDLSHVLFITTANYEENIPTPLRDRMDIVRLSSYTYEEKQVIAKRYLFPKQLKKCGLKNAALKISDDALRKIISEYTSEGGVRNLERCLNRICSKTAVKILQDGVKAARVTVKNLEEYLGAGKIPPEQIPRQNTVGVVTGLAYTEVGGAILPIEVNVMDGTGKTEITGQIGDVMKESARAAVSYIRANANLLGVSETFYKDKDIHIHVPDGATPKDGPSAGCAIATAVLSRLTGQKVRRDVAMTGEITITGKVLPIGGLKEKTIAAYKAGVKQIIIPADNKPNMEDVAKNVRENTQFYFASDISQVFDLSLIPNRKNAETRASV